jgi:hypothetical protein
MVGEAGGGATSAYNSLAQGTGRSDPWAGRGIGDVARTLRCWTSARSTLDGRGLFRAQAVPPAALPLKGEFRRVTNKSEGEYDQRLRCLNDVTIAARAKAMDNEIQRWVALIVLIVGLGLASYVLYVSFGPLPFHLLSRG